MSRLIDADALKKEIEDVQYTQEFCIEHQIDYSISMRMLSMIIDNAPTVEQQKGKWIYSTPVDKEKEYGGYCSRCKCDMPIFIEDWKQVYCETDYCPNCGAKMKGGEENA